MYLYTPIGQKKEPMYWFTYINAYKYLHVYGYMISYNFILITIEIIEYIENIESSIYANIFNDFVRYM